MGTAPTVHNTQHVLSACGRCTGGCGVSGLPDEQIVKPSVDRSKEVTPAVATTANTDCRINAYAAIKPTARRQIGIWDKRPTEDIPHSILH
jgi:hypothetical protein